MFRSGVRADASAGTAIHRCARCAEEEGKAVAVKQNISRSAGKRALVLAVASGLILVIIAAVAGRLSSCARLNRRVSGASNLKECGKESLATAAKAGDVAAVRCHLVLGASAQGTVPGDPERTPLLSAASLAGHANVVSLLIEHGARIEETCNRGRTPLMWAAHRGNREIIEMLVTALERQDPTRVSSYIDTADREGMTALMLASMADHRVAVRSLVNRGASVEKVNRAGFSALSYSITAGNAHLLRELLSKYSRESLTNSELRLAVARKCHECLAALLESGAGGESAINEKATETARLIDPVAMATGMKDIAALKILASHGKLERAGPLHLASARGELDMVRILIELGASVNSRRERDGRTPLIAAVAARSRAEILRLLLERGADPNSFDSNRETALLVATRVGDLEAVMLLLSYRANPDINDRFGQTPLILATRAGKAEIVSALLDARADITLSDTNGQAVLAAAIRSRQTPVLKLLLERGASIDQRDRQGVTPLMMAAELGEEAAVKLLLDHGASTLARDKFGLDARQRAIRAGRSAIAEIVR